MKTKAYNEMAVSAAATNGEKKLSLDERYENERENRSARMRGRIASRQRPGRQSSTDILRLDFNEPRAGFMDRMPAMPQMPRMMMPNMAMPDMRLPEFRGPPSTTFEGASYGKRQRSVFGGVPPGFFETPWD